MPHSRGRPYKGSSTKYVIRTAEAGLVATATLISAIRELLYALYHFTIRLNLTPNTLSSHLTLLILILQACVIVYIYS